MMGCIQPSRREATKGENEEILWKALNNVLAQGIEECESPYASPVVLVLKLDDRMRSEAEQKASETDELSYNTSCLKQRNCSKNFILRTDAGNCAMSGVFLQGDDKTNEHPIVNAIRLLTAAERNYSTTKEKLWHLKVWWVHGVGT
ncbi:hypothetical protein CDAR_424661 [Caerostris darwini]|uniref:Reverse transcriptase/retrotransposon-derived protein RNase H-like domain-containing protein n=1 Tax=Caerostris darwini TaxID=1538125 RepID=A0AAV4VBB5_9ARAC|nr:hypothetical protein CDAR_424661 [Caerostris darwini]